MSNEDDDVLKRLRSVRKRLQESLDDTGKVVERDAPKESGIELVDAQKELEREDRRKAFEAGKVAPTGPKLYQTTADNTPKVSDKDYKKGSGGVSRKRIAAMQRRVRKTVQERRGVPRKQKAIMLTGICLAALPLMLISTLSLATCRFDFNSIGIEYKDRPGEIMLTLPVYNPTFIPAHLGDIDLQLYAMSSVEGSYINVARIHTSYQKVIDPYSSTVIDINIKLDPQNAPIWLKDLFNTFTLELMIRNFQYNGIKLASDIKLPAIDLSDMVRDLTSGLSIDSLTSGDGGLFGAALSTNDALNLWQMAGNPVHPSYASTSPSAAQNGSVNSPKPPSFELLDLGLDENSDRFRFKVDAAFYMSPLQNMYLGPIRILNFSTSLYGPGGNGADMNNPNSTNYFKNKIATLSTQIPKIDVISPFNWIGAERDLNYPVEINFGAVSYAAAMLTVFKDDIGGASTHPSANLDFKDPVAVAQFEKDHKLDLPMWYFINNLMAHQMIECAIRVDTLSIQIFGIDIKDISIDQSLLPILRSTKPLFNITDLVSGMGVQPMGLISSFVLFGQSVTTMGIGSNPIAAAPPITSPYSIDQDKLSEMLGDFDTDQLFDSITESWDETANISLALGVEINNTILDLHLALQNLSVGISNKYVNEFGIEKEAVFAFAKAYNEYGGTDVFFPKMGEATTIYLNLTIMKNDEYKPFVEQFIRDLLGTFTINGRLVLTLEYLILFQENYTFAGLQLAIDAMMLTDTFGLDLSGLIEDLIRGLLEDDLMEMLTGSTENLKLHPLGAPIELMTLLGLCNPIFAPIMGTQFPGMQILGKNGQTKAFTPEAAQEDDKEYVEIVVTDYGYKIVLDVLVPGLELGEGTLPIHLGLGYSYLEIQTNSTNTYGDWAPLVGIGINEYIEIGPKTSKLDLNVQLTIYQTSTLCDLFNALTDGRDTPTMSLRIAGFLTLNLSGVFMPNLELALEIKDLKVSVNMQDVVDMLISSLARAEPTAQLAGPQESIAKKQLQWWDGKVKPISSQDINMDSLFEIGGLELSSGLVETHWPDVDRGTVSLEIGIELTNHLMSIALLNPIMQIFDDYGVLIATLDFMSNEVRLQQEVALMVQAKMTLYKSLALQTWINTILSSLYYPGFLNMSLSIEVFGCVIGPIRITGPLNELATMLGFDILSLLGMIIPMSPYTLRDSPQASQDVMDMIGNFGIGYVTTRRNGTLSSPINPVGPLDYDNPMFSVIAGLILQPKFNMSILDADLYLCDKNIYDRIYTASKNDAKEAIKYSKIAQVTMDPFPVYANNTYDPNTDFNAPNVVARGVNADNYMYNIDPDKPYYDWNNNHTGPLGLHYYQEYNNSNYNLPRWHPYGLGTFAMTDVVLNLFNISHGEPSTQYPKKYWRAMGGPYFPVQVFDKDHGGYPDHKYVYHPHFSPLAALLSKIDMALSDPMALFDAITFAGNLTINIFSMNLTLDARSEAVESLISSLTIETLNLFLDNFRKATTPWADRQAPEYANMDRILRIQEYADPTIPRFATHPLSAEFYTDLEIDLESFIDDYPYIGFETRNDHIYAPGAHGKAAGGSTQYMNNYRYMGNNFNPFNYDMSVKADYKPGLWPTGSTRERFVKDQFYEDYKLVVQNWANGVGRMNPFFESENLTTYEPPNAKNGYRASYELIPDHKQWPVRWGSYTDPFEPSFIGQRIPSVAGIYFNGIVPAFEFGILSAHGNVWNEDPAPGKDCSQLTPIGYLWINNTVFPQLRAGRDTNFWQNELYLKPGANGDVYSNSSWVPINIRLFECLGTREFVRGLADVFNFNLHMYIDIALNASLFGYEAYGLVLSKLSLGGYNQYETRCADELSQGQSGSVWGVPGTDGALEPPKDPVPEWLPKEFLPQFKSDTYSLDMNMLLNGLTNIDFGEVLSNGLSLDASGITITLQLPLQTPLTLPAWITHLEGTFCYNFDQTYYNHTNPYNWNVLINLGSLGEIFREINVFWHDGANVLNRDNPNPYDINANMIGTYPAGAPNPGAPEIAYGEEIILPPISVSITFLDLMTIIGGLDINLLQVVWRLITGDPLWDLFPPYLWITLLKDRWELFKLKDGMPWTNPTGGLLHALLFPAFGYDFPIEIDYKMVSMNLIQLLEGTLKHPDGFFDEDLGPGYVSREWQWWVDQYNDNHGGTRWPERVNP